MLGQHRVHTLGNGAAKKAPPWTGMGVLGAVLAGDWPSRSA
jgi:hypothetical protein